MLRNLLESVRSAYAALRRYGGYRLYERPLGIETSKVVRLSELGLDRLNRRDYEPSPWLALKRVLAQRDVSSEDVFIDFGSGKGPVVLQAARYPFRKIIGVELAPELHAVATSNIERALPTLVCKNIELVNKDVLDYDIPDDVTVAYFYNPFEGAIFASVIEKLVASIKRRPRMLRIVYMNSVEEDVLLCAGATLIKATRGLRPTKEWSRENSIKLYRLA
jgi:Histone methylation protein DOT1